MDRRTQPARHLHRTIQPPVEPSTHREYVQCGTLVHLDGFVRFGATGSTVGGHHADLMAGIAQARNNACEIRAYASAAGVDGGSDKGNPQTTRNSRHRY